MLPLATLPEDGRYKFTNINLYPKSFIADEEAREKRILPWKKRTSQLKIIRPVDFNHIPAAIRTIILMSVS
jgi:hypothetical protein